MGVKHIPIDASTKALMHERRELKAEIVALKNDKERLQDHLAAKHLEVEELKNAGTEKLDLGWGEVTTKDYRDSLAAGGGTFFSLGYQWQDKPHRHVFQLTKWVDSLAHQLKEVRAERDRQYEFNAELIHKQTELFSKSEELEENPFV